MKVRLKSPVEFKTLKKNDGSGSFELAVIQYGDVEASCFISDKKFGQELKAKLQQFVAGQEIEVEIEKNDRGYLNFSLPNQTTQRIIKLENQLSWMYNHLADQGLLPKKEAQQVQPIFQPQPTPEEQLNIADQIDF